MLSRLIQGLKSMPLFFCPIFIQRNTCACLHAQLLQLWQALYEPMDCSPPGLSGHGILQTRILEWVAISSCRGSSWPRGWTCISWVALQAGFFIAALQGDSLPLSHWGSPSRNLFRSYIHTHTPTHTYLYTSIGLLVLIFQRIMWFN